MEFKIDKSDKLNATLDKFEAKFKLNSKTVESLAEEFTNCIKEEFSGSDARLLGMIDRGRGFEIQAELEQDTPIIITVSLKSVE